LCLAVNLAISARGDRLNVILLRAFNGHAKLSQTDLFRKAIDNGVKLTQPQVRDYILEGAGLITSPPTTYAKAYELTEQGKWSRHVINQLLQLFCLF
jgi:hypothetical protein